MTDTLKARLWLALRIALGATVFSACVWFVRGLPLRSLWQALSSASLPLVLAAATLNLVQVGFRAAVVRTLLLPVRVVPLSRLYRYSLTTFAANNVLPGRAGEIVRVYLLRNREGVPTAAAVALALVEKAFEVLAMLLVVAPAPLLLPGLPRSVALAVKLLALGGVVVWVAAWLLARSVRDPAPGQAEGWFSRLARGAQIIRRPRLALVALGFSVAGWVTDAVEVWLVLQAVGIDVPWAAAQLTLLVLNLAIAIPTTPAALGPFEAAAVGALALLGVPMAPALAFALIYHGMQIIPVTLLGAPGLRLARAATASAAAAASSSSSPAL